VDARQPEESIADEAMGEAVGSLIPMKVSSEVLLIYWKVSIRQLL